MQIGKPNVILHALFHFMVNTVNTRKSGIVAFSREISLAKKNKIEGSLHNL